MIAAVCARLRIRTKDLSKYWRGRRRVEGARAALAAPAYSARLLEHPGAVSAKTKHTELVANRPCSQCRPTNYMCAARPKRAFGCIQAGKFSWCVRVRLLVRYFIIKADRRTMCRPSEQQVWSEDVCAYFCLLANLALDGYLLDWMRISHPHGDGGCPQKCTCLPTVFSGRAVPLRLARAP